jgi:hypothetical protein
VTPTEEQLFQKYNPDLKKKSLERRRERQQEFEDFVLKLKDQAKSDKPSQFATLRNKARRRMRIHC